MDALGRRVNSVNSKLDQIMGYETAFFMLLLPSLRSEYRSPSFALPSLLIGFQNFEASVKMLVWVFYPLGLGNQEADQPLKEGLDPLAVFTLYATLRCTIIFTLSNFRCTYQHTPQ